MNADSLREVVTLADRVGHIFVATVDLQGTPHIAAAGKMCPIRDGVAVESFFCPGTLSNLQHSRRIALVVWDPQTDEGYQVLGQVQAIEDVSILDGWEPQEEGQPPLPQVDRRLLVRVEQVLEFTHAPHSDLVLG